MSPSSVCGLAMLPILALLALLPVDARGEPMSVDRPGRGESPHLVGRGVVQLEAGVQYERGGDDAADELIVPDTLLRVGLLERLELRLETEGFSYEQPVDGGHRSGWADLEVGAKLLLLEPAVALPKSSLLVQMSLPVGASSITSGAYDPTGALLLGWDLTDRLDLEVSLEIAQPTSGENETRRVFTFTPSISLECTWTDRLSSYLEYYTELRGRGESDEHVIDGGVGFFVTDDVVLDAWAGVGLTSDSPDFQVGGGISIRF